MVHESHLGDPLTRIGFNTLVARALAGRPEGAHIVARIVELASDHCRIHVGTEVHLAPVTSSLVVGDWVTVELDAHRQCSIKTRLAPYTELSRITPSGAHQVLVTNVDYAFLVMGLDGDFSPRRLERYLTLVKAGGVVPVVVLTKADLCADVDAKLDALAGRLPSSIERYAINACDRAAAATLEPYLAPGNTAVLLGSSGAGKSTLTNTLMGFSGQKTAAVREDDSRGRHTTTSRQLREMPSGGALIDTPGLRGLRLAITESDLEAAFEDIGQLASQCRFRDCQHESEPGCAVRAALSPDRLANYQKLRREIARDQATTLERQARKAHVKAMHRAIRAKQKLDG